MSQFNSYLRLLGFIFLFFVSSSYAEPMPYNNVIFFGDSLSDNGNLYSFDYGYLPKSPPYYQGRFSNGNVWSETVMQHLYNKSYISSTNYAIGGETAIFHNPVNGYLPYSLTASLNSYLLHSIFRDRSTTLYVIWIGSNDYLPGTTNVEQLTNDVIGNIKNTIESLIYHGGKNFLVINLPDFGKTPYGIESNMVDVLHQIATVHNNKLSTLVTDIQNGYKEVNIHLLDINTMFTDLIAHPDVYNKKYNVNITNTTTACWQGGYSARRNIAKQLNDQVIAQEFEQQMKLKLKNVGPATKRLDPQEFAQFISASPALREAHEVSDRAANGEEPCNNPDNYVFWDHVHPTAVVHMMLSQYADDFLTANYLLASR